MFEVRVRYKRNAYNGGQRQEIARLQPSLALDPKKQGDRWQRILEWSDLPRVANMQLVRNFPALIIILIALPQLMTMEAASLLDLQRQKALPP